MKYLLIPLILLLSGCSIPREELALEACQVGFYQAVIKFYPKGTLSTEEYEAKFALGDSICLEDMQKVFHK